jgi:hypothetical protein
VLPIKRTLQVAEIDEIISDVHARKAVAIEHWRRADWCNRELAASRFRAASVHAYAAALPISCTGSDAMISAT